MFAMFAPVPLCPDFTAADLRHLARHAGDANQTRRLLALATIHDGGSRTDAARVGGVGLRIIRDWVVRFDADGPDGLINRHAPCHPPLLNDARRRALVALVESGPIPAVHGGVRWRPIDLAQWAWEEFRISISIFTLSRELRGLGYRKLSARPRHHAQATGAIEDFNKVSLKQWARSPVRKASQPTPWRYGSQMKPAWGRRTRSPAVGRGAGPGRQPRMTNARLPPISSARSVRVKAKVPLSCCRTATQRWLGNFGQPDRLISCLTAAMLPRIRL
jgi:transposase